MLKTKHDLFFVKLTFLNLNSFLNAMFKFSVKLFSQKILSKNLKKSRFLVWKVEFYHVFPVIHAQVKSKVP